MNEDLKGSIEIVKRRLEEQDHGTLLFSERRSIKTLITTAEQVLDAGSADCEGCREKDREIKRLEQMSKDTWFAAREQFKFDLAMETHKLKVELQNQLTEKDREIVEWKREKEFWEKSSEEWKERYAHWREKYEQLTDAIFKVVYGEGD